MTCQAFLKNHASEIAAIDFFTVAKSICPSLNLNRLPEQVVFLV